MEPLFDRYVGINYSGAQTPTSSLLRLRIYLADRETPPREVPPPSSPRKYWSRREIAEWLKELLSEDRPTLAGIGHGFSFPLQYFFEHRVLFSWTAFLDDFQRHWPTDDDNLYVCFVRDGVHGNAAARYGNRRWLRLTEVRAGITKSLFHFEGPRSVAMSTHAGLPWLFRLRRMPAGRVHFWPFDGWDVPPGKSVVAEVYPSLWSKGSGCEGRDPYQHAAYSIAAWMQQADANGSLAEFFHPRLEGGDRKIAEIEGWILGVA